jgi:hypothetical protein
MPHETPPPSRERFAPFLFGIIQSGLTTGLASGIGTLSAAPAGVWPLLAWLKAWAAAWALMIPVVIAAAPLIQKLVRKLLA